MTPTNQNIANFYGVSLSTVKNYKRAKDEKRLLYEAMKRYFIEEDEDNDINLFRSIRNKDFVFNCDEYKNGEHVIKVKRGNPVYRRDSGCSLVHYLNESGEVVPYSDISFLKLYRSGLIVEATPKSD